MRLAVERPDAASGKADGELRLGPSPRRPAYAEDPADIRELKLRHWQPAIDARDAGERAREAPLSCHRRSQSPRQRQGPTLA